VILVEREATPLRLARPEVLWGATLAALDTLGVADWIRDEASVLLDGIEIRDPSGTSISLSREDMSAASVRGYSTQPTLTRATLVEAALATGCVEVHRNAKVDGLLRDGSRIRGVSGKRAGETFALEARMVVGDDGIHSAVRTGIGIPLALSDFPIDFLSATLRWPASLSPARVSAHLDPAAFRAGMPAAVFISWPHGEGVLLVPLSSQRAERLLADSEESFWIGLQELTPLATDLRGQLAFPRDFTRVNRPFGNAERYAVDGAALLGDAAHPMTPAGGQGANAAIFDALALAEVADIALSTGEATRASLLEYERRRHPINARSVRISATARRAFRLAAACRCRSSCRRRLAWPTASPGPSAARSGPSPRPS
jgi:2-polyprenyl-6-methoxyphenol hydroxylase-like FAD-dependent oxidoreductase